MYALAALVASILAYRQQGEGVAAPERVLRTRLVLAALPCAPSSYLLSLPSHLSRSSYRPQHQILHLYLRLLVARQEVKRYVVSIGHGQALAEELAVEVYLLV